MAKSRRRLGFPMVAVGLVAMLTVGCVTRRAAAFMTVPRRATDGAFWEQRSQTKPQRFEVTAKDGIRLSALVLNSAPGVPKRGTAYLFHGFGNTKEQMLPTAKRLSAAGFRCVAWDSRGHGKSGGDRATYGKREVDDAMQVIAAARKNDTGQRGKEVAWAFSMGTAVALQTLPKVPEISSAVLLAPIADLNDVLRDQAGGVYYGMARPLVPMIRASVRYQAGFDPKSIRPVDVVKKTNCRLLLIHGSGDGVIFPRQSQRILDAAAPGQARRVVLPGVTHQGIMWDLPEKTREDAVGFLLKKD